MNILGIDPGASGAAALLAPDGRVLGVLDWTDGPRVAAELACWEDLWPFRAYLEKVHAMPKNGVAGMFNFGMNFGWWQGWLDGHAVPWEFVAPQKWMTNLIPPKRDPADKPSLLVARRMFPDAPLHLKKHHGRADALLIAHWGRLNSQGKGIRCS